MAEKNRPRMPAAQRRELLMDAAQHIMKESGIAAATTRAITAQAGMPHGAFHYCFSSKEELFSALLHRELDASLKEAWDAVSGQPTSFFDALLAALLAYLDRVQQDPEHHILITELTATASRTPELAELPAWEHEQYVNHVTELLKSWRAHTGNTLVMPLRSLAEVLTTCASGLGATWLATRDTEKSRASARLLASALAQAATGTARM